MSSIAIIAFIDSTLSFYNSGSMYGYIHDWTKDQAFASGHVGL